MAAPRKGEIIDGYEFLGGDPNDQASWQEWGAGARRLPTGAIVRDGPRGGLQELRKAGGDEEGGGAPLREFEINAAARATLMDEGQREYLRAREEGYDPGAVRNGIAMGLEGLPLVGRWGADVLRDNPSERGRVAELQFAEGALRTTTGANAPEPEVRNASRMYFRQPGESAAVEPNKEMARERFRKTAVRAAGRAYSGREGDGASTVSPKRPPVPPAARAQAARLRAQGAITQTGAFGTQQNPYVARDAKVFNQLSNDPAYRGKFIIDPNGNFGVIE